MDAPVQEGEILAGKYRVEKILGFGGMGVVVSAFRGDLEQRVAVKFLSQAAAERPDAAARFRREARAAAKIKSDHVARVLDVGTLDTGLPYMVMEFLEGHDIAEELRQVERLPIPDAVGFTLQAVEALAEAHAAGVVHRDLKPGNLFLARRPDGTRRVKVLDFGISKALSGSSVEDLSLTKTAALIGSPLYMAPEQMRSAKDVDTRADIWSLGAMLYEMLTGQLPYMGESIPQLCAALLHDDPIPLRQHRPEIPEGLEYAVLRCLMKDRTQRFQTVYDLGRALVPYTYGDARVHVERAERLLGFADRSQSSLNPMGEHRSEHRPHGVSMPVTPLNVTPAQMATVPIEPTVHSWGQSKLSGAPKRRAALLVIGGLAAVIAGVGGLLAARASAPEAKPAASGASPNIEAKADTRPAPIPAPPPVDESAPSAVPSSTAVVASPPPALSVPKPKAALAPKPAAKKTEPQKPEIAAAPPTKPGGIPDFGGRR